MMSEKIKHENVEKNKKKENRKQITDKLYGVCIFGGHLPDIKKAISENEYTVEELEKAIDVLRNNTTAAIELLIAKENEKYIRKIINGIKFSRKTKNKH